MTLSPKSKIAIGAFIAGNITMYLYMNMTVYKPIQNEMKRIEGKKQQFHQDFKAREDKFMMDMQKWDKEWKKIDEERQKRSEEYDKARKEWNQKFDQTTDEIIKSIKDDTYFNKGGFQAFSDKHEKIMKSGKEALEKRSEQVRQDAQKQIDHIEDKVDEVSQIPFIETMGGSKIEISPFRDNKKRPLDPKKSSEINQLSEKEE